jgi:glycosyltransferase involved in cell wall biosynthesis
MLTLARLSAAEQYKGLDEVIELMPALLILKPNLKYMIVGDGDDRCRLEAKAQSLGLGDKVVFTGMVSEADKADFFRLADAFVMPGTGEGFGFVFLEAMACGIPVVGSLKDGSREALRDGMLGELVDPGDPLSIQQGILNALERVREVPAGLDHFAWPAFSARVAHAVRTLLG